MDECKIRANTLKELRQCYNEKNEHQNELRYKMVRLINKRDCCRKKLIERKNYLQQSAQQNLQTFEQLNDATTTMMMMMIGNNK